MIRLNLGCGQDIRPGYVNVDVRNLPGVDLVLNLETDNLPYEDNSVDEILAKDVIEHFSFRNIEKVLREWHRVLKPEGLLTIQTPDFEQIVAKFNSGQIKTWDELSYWLYGAQDYPENHHKAIFTKAELQRLLEHIGFEVIEIWNDNSNMICKAKKKNRISIN